MNTNTVTSMAGTTIKKDYVIPISDLLQNPYMTGWKIKVRVVRKGQIRETQGGKGRICNIDFIDREDQISCTLFKESIDQYI